MADNWTQTPNHILDNMHQMKPGVFKVCMAIARQTCGFQKEWDVLSTSRLEKITGLSNRAVIDSIREAIDGGWIDRREKGQWFEYRIKPVNFFHSFDTATYEKSSQVTYEKSSQVEPTYEKSSQEPMRKVHTQYKKENINIITHEKRKSVSAKNEETETPEHQQWFSAVCWLVHGHKDYKLLGKTEKLAIATTVKAIRESNEHYTIDDLRTWYSGVWSKSWPGLQKNGAIQKPRLKDIKTGIGQVRTLNKPPPQALNGNHTSMSVFDRDFQGSEA